MTRYKTEKAYSTTSTEQATLTSHLITSFYGLFHPKQSSPLSPSKILSQKIKNCIELINEHENDIYLIREALHQCSHDVLANEQEQETEIVSYEGFQYLQRRQKTTKRNLEHRIDLLNHLSELLDSYPIFHSDEALTCHDIDSFYSDRAAHHTDVFAIVEQYLPETYAAIAESKTVLNKK